MDKIDDPSMLEELRSLKEQLLSINERLLIQTESIDKSTTSFLITEFEQLGEFWRQTDSRMEATIDHYLTAVAAVVAGILIFSPRVSNLEPFLGILALVSLVVAGGGYIVSKRTTEARNIKHEYILALNLIRGYFVERDRSIANYLLLPYIDPRAYSDLFGGGQGSSRRVFDSFLSLLNSLLMGFAGGVGYWLLFPQRNVIVAVVIAVTIATFCTFGFSTLRNRSFVAHQSDMDRRLKSLASIATASGNQA